MKVSSIKKISSLLLLLALPSLSSALPMSWNYSGVCGSGDCDVVPSITGTLSGDPALYGPSNELNEFVLVGDLTSYSFTIGSYEFSGTSGLGTYLLDGIGNIVGGSMTFGNLLQLEFLGVGSAQWNFTDTDCRFIFCSEAVDASGSGGYTVSSTSVPEPGTLGLMGLALLGAGAASRQKKKA